jgi:hypothetical protein
VSGVKLTGTVSRDSLEPAVTTRRKKNIGHNVMPEKLRTPQAPA